MSEKDCGSDSYKPKKELIKQTKEDKVIIEKNKPTEEQLKLIPDETKGFPHALGKRTCSNKWNCVVSKKDKKTNKPIEVTCSCDDMTDSYLLDLLDKVEPEYGYILSGTKVVISAPKDKDLESSDTYDLVNKVVFNDNSKIECCTNKEMSPDKCPTDFCFDSENCVTYIKDLCINDYSSDINEYICKETTKDYKEGDNVDGYCVGSNKCNDFLNTYCLDEKNKETDMCKTFKENFCKDEKNKNNSICKTNNSNIIIYISIGAGILFLILLMIILMISLF